MKKFIDSKCKGQLLKMNIQLFADADNGDDTGGNSDGETPTEGEIRFASQAEFDSAADKRTAKALATAKAKWEAEKKAAIDAARSEAEKMASLTADQKAEVEKQKEADALASREADITRRELRAQSLEQLAEKELPKELIEVVVLTDAESCTKSIEAIENSFRAAVELGVNKRLAESANDLPGGSGAKATGKESIGKRLAQQTANNKTKNNPYFKEN